VMRRTVPTCSNVNCITGNSADGLEREAPHRSREAANQNRDRSRVAF
jgi:hypothetical protein